MKYRLIWSEHWSEQRESDDPRLIIRYTKVDYDQIEHEYIYYFDAAGDEDAKRKTLNYIEQSTDTMEVWSLYNRETKQVIMTEEEL